VGVEVEIRVADVDVARLIIEEVDVVVLSAFATDVVQTKVRKVRKTIFIFIIVSLYHISLP
jgi:hypothetical protein